MAHRNRRDIPTILRYKGNRTGHSTDRKLLCHSRVTHKKETTVVLIYGFTNKLQARLVPATLSLLEDWGSLDHTTCCFGMVGKLKNKKHQCWWRVLISALLQGSPLPCNERNDPAGFAPCMKPQVLPRFPAAELGLGPQPEQMGTNSKTGIGSDLLNALRCRDTNALFGSQWSFTTANTRHDEGLHDVHCPSSSTPIEVPMPTTRASHLGTCTPT